MAGIRLKGGGEQLRGPGLRSVGALNTSSASRATSCLLSYQRLLPEQCRPLVSMVMGAGLGVTVLSCLLLCAVKRKKAILSDSEDEEQLDRAGELSSISVIGRQLCGCRWCRWC